MLENLDAAAGRRCQRADFDSRAALYIISCDGATCRVVCLVLGWEANIDVSIGKQVQV